MCNIQNDVSSFLRRNNSPEKLNDTIKNNLRYLLQFLIVKLVVI